MPGTTSSASDIYFRGPIKTSAKFSAGTYFQEERKETTTDIPRNTVKNLHNSGYIKTHAMETSTPRVTCAYLNSYVGRNVMVVGKVAQIRGEDAIIDADGNISCKLNRVSFSPSSILSLPQASPHNQSNLIDHNMHKIGSEHITTQTYHLCSSPHYPQPHADKQQAFRASKANMLLPSVGCPPGPGQRCPSHWQSKPRPVSQSPQLP